MERVEIWSSPQRTEVPEKEGSQDSVKVGCGQFLECLDAAGVPTTRV